MSWEAWAAIGQLIGAVGVIASLVFVGIQVRQSVRAAKATAFQGLVSSIIAVNKAHIENPEILEIIDRAGKGVALGASEHQLYVALVLSAARLAQSAHYQTQLGLLDDQSSNQSFTTWCATSKRKPAKLCGQILGDEVTHNSGSILILFSTGPTPMNPCSNRVPLADLTLSQRPPTRNVGNGSKSVATGMGGKRTHAGVCIYRRI